MDQAQNSKQSSGEETHKRRRRHTRHKKDGKSIVKDIAKWLKKHPLKVAAFIFVGFIIYLSFLFYNYDNYNPTSNEIVSNNKVVRGILLPMRLLSEISEIYLDFGKTQLSVSIDQLKAGYKVSPMSIAHCSNNIKPGDPSDFIIYLVEDRIYISTNFKDLYDDKIIGSVNKKDWTFLSKNISAVRTDDYSFEVFDRKENVIFAMQFKEPGIISIQGYFIGEECIYILNDDGAYSDTKTGNYVERVLPQIKNIKKIW
ncbi:MAG: hypothetical protein ABIO55_11345 [Ginsengibacter sp.]